MLVIMIWVVVLDRGIWRAVKADRWLGSSIEQGWEPMTLGPCGTRYQLTLGSRWTRCQLIESCFF